MKNFDPKKADSIFTGAGQVGLRTYNKLNYNNCV